MSTFSKQAYQKIAEVLAETLNNGYISRDQVYSVKMRLSEMFYRDNPNYRSDKFHAAFLDCLAAHAAKDAAAFTSALKARSRPKEARTRRFSAKTPNRSAKPKSAP